MFVDQVQIKIQAGSGGNGCDSYYQRTDRKTVPHGGDGGDGGSVVFRADRNAPGLENFRFHQNFTALNGGHGGSDKKRGRNAEDLIILVPPGTEIYDKERGLLIRKLSRAGEEVIAVQGGVGGHGNQGGKLAATGERGRVLELELKLHIPADVFLIGLPSSGKSAFMNKMTRTHLKEENYPFATRTPEMGVWKYSDYESLTLCELPSLYESSHEGRGLGADFLKHLESARHILYFVDPVSQFAGSFTEGYEILRKQLQRYSEDLLEVPHAVVVTKTDLPEFKTKCKVKKKKYSAKVPIFYISNVTGDGLKELSQYLKKILDKKEKENASATA